MAGHTPHQMAPLMGPEPGQGEIMAKKNKTGSSSPSKAVPVQAGATNEEHLMKAAALICGAEFAALRVIRSVDEKYCGPSFDIPAVLKQLRDHARTVKGGDMSQAEAMLTNQATALQSLFARLVERGMEQTLMPNIEGFMKLALRAQNQCRATLETMATIKNPPVVFAKQANFANGPQQVNNGNEAPRAREDKIEQTQLLENAPNERLDFGTKETAGENDQTMATVGKSNRTPNRERETGQRKARL